MPRGMSEDVSNVIVQALNRGLSRSQISGVVGVSRRAITRINTNLRKHGSPKAPAKGLKLGRPTKLTKSQADAMVVWMTERNHTFYVKDLVRFLREGYGYRGCDGTVRRCLVRAGYKRKLPWHKSEITTWVPPDHAPVFATVEDPQPGAPANDNGAEDEDNNENDENDETQTEHEQGDNFRQDIDPALQASPSSHQTAATHLQQQRIPNSVHTVIAPNHLTQTHIPPSPYIDQSLAPRLQQSATSPSQSMPQPTHQPPFETSTTAIQPDSLTNPPHSNQANSESRNPVDISTLQSQIAEQQALIQSLQQQLAQQAK